MKGVDYDLTTSFELDPIKTFVFIESSLPPAIDLEAKKTKKKKTNVGYKGFGQSFEG